MTQQPDQNIQHGVAVGDGMRDADERVATGDRRQDVHFERRANGELRAEHLKKPEGPLPPQMETADGLPANNGPPVEDVAVAPEGPSVWDARPTDDGHDHPGKR
ncbi:hypothetical protein [Phenylobacterium sp.]|uniref:hypothetical protein n=1 Tax=Phenylobacterium sp. TaxID=1871053 RepID=UPI002812264D|nr:hypothetical protein [Phenylobacterium sp.]